MTQTFGSFADVRVTDRSLVWNTDLVETMELDNLIAAGDGDDAFGRATHGEPRRACPRGLPESRRRELDEAHAGLGRRSWQVRFDYRPVHLNTLTDDVEPIPPKARVLTESDLKQHMAQFTLTAEFADPAWQLQGAPAPEGATKIRTFRIYRFDPGPAQNPRVDTYRGRSRRAVRWCSMR